MKNIKYTLSLLSLLIFCLPDAFPFERSVDISSVYYIDGENASDTNHGNKEAPFATISAADPNIPELPELNWEKRSDWIDVTKDVSPAAVGDGGLSGTARGLQRGDSCTMAGTIPRCCISTRRL